MTAFNPDEKLLIDSCLRMTKYDCDKLRKGDMTLPEFMYAVTLAVARAPGNCMDRCVDMIPDFAVAPYVEYLKAELEPVDFMPWPGGFLVDRSEENVAKKKVEMRPAYIRLYQLVKDRLKACQDSK